jgi:hypothetical protein
MTKKNIKIENILKIKKYYEIDIKVENILFPGNVSSI